MANSFVLRAAPRALLDDCADEMRGWIAQSGKTIAVEVPSDLPQLSVDVRLLRRVLLNMISNAIKHTPPGTQILLRAYVAPRQSLLVDGQGATSELIVEVEDNGPGIPAEHLTRIFDKFGRFSSECHARQDSIGLGLTFCQLAIEAHGGLISVSSVIGQSTTFRVVLPSI